MLRILSLKEQEMGEEVVVRMAGSQRAAWRAFSVDF